MRTSSRLYLSRFWFRLGLIVCLASSILGYIPAIVRGGVVLADDPPPPEIEREELPTELPAVEEGQPSAPLPPLASAAPPVTHTIHLKSRQFEPSPADVLDANGLQRLARPDRERIHVLVQLDFIPRQAAKDELAARGLRLLAYVPDYAWIASVAAAAAATAVDSPGVTWVGELTVDDKLAPAITADQWGEHNLAPDGTAAVYASLHQDESLDTGRDLVKAHGGEVKGEVQGINMLVVEMPRDNIRALAAEDAVQWIEPAAPPLGDANDGIRPQIGVDTVNAAPYNLDGTDVDVLVYDGGQVGAHVDFGARLTVGLLDASGVSEHATHVAGTVGGSGANSAAQGGSALQWRGMAPNVGLISYGYEWDSTGILFYSNPGDIELDWARGKVWYGADVGTASLSSNIYDNYAPTYCYLMGNYGDTSVLMDQIVRGGNPLVGVGNKYIATWAAGNERGSGSSCDTYRTTSPPAAAKNPIHVGASNTNNNSMTSFSSWGPTDDGRIKPTIVAGGCQSSGDFGIKSTDNNPVNAYTVKCGTSMATPAVAGSIALMLQHYRDVYNTTGNFWPSTAKAILIQTADDLGNSGPDYQWGYGQVDIQAAVDLISRRAFRQESIAQGEVDVYYLIVPDDASPATVSLAWDDYEATLNANPTLINNLDLELVAPDGTLWRPWVLDAANPANNATRGTDNRNNQEQVQVFAADEAIIGTWLVRVRGTSVPQGPQDYSLACEGCQPLNLGVCQDTVTSAAAAAALGPKPVSEAGLQAEGPFPERAAEELAPGAPPPTEGELWQRALEIQAEAGAIAQAEAARAALEAEIAAFEVARQAGPRATVALLDTLSSAALDLVEEEIVKAQEQLHESAPPPPETGPVSEAEEQAVLEAQKAVEATNRARALADYTDPAEGQSLISNLQPPVSSPTRPAADLTVGNGCTYATIASAIAAAIPGDRLLIEGGVTFVENPYIPISLTLQGGYDGCASGSTARTTIDGNAINSVIRVQAGLEVTLENLNITNGYTGGEGGGIELALGSGTGRLTLTNVDIYGNTGQWGGGLWAGLDTEVIGTNVEIYNNTATAYGGGVRLYGGRATFDCSSSATCNIRDNVAPAGGGVYGTLQDGHAPSLNLLANADVHHNQALTGNGSGGGVYMRQGSLSLADCSDLRYNDAIDGGGAYLITTTLTVNGSCSEIEYNEATGNGGGVYAQGSGVNLDDDAWLYDNNATTGGGAYLDNSSLYSDKGSIRFNTANYRGGGVYATNGSVVDMDLGGYPCLGTHCSELTYNTATTYYGGGVYVNDSTVDLRNTFVENNTADYGGGVYAYDNSTVYAYNNLFARNNATSGIGDAIRLNLNVNMYGAGNTLAYNNAGGAATGQAIGLATSSLSLHCSVIWAHTNSINVTGENVTYSDVQGGYAGTGNLDVNPLFVAPGSDDYHLQTSSPVIDRCQYFSGMNTDLDNQTRPMVRTTAASPYDMGADEVAGVDRVGLNGTGCAYPTIQQAVNAAGDGDTIQVAEGVYFENVNINSNQIVTIEGGYDSTCTTAGPGTTRIEGSAGSGSTLDVYSYATVTLSDLQIAWGNGYGGGVEAYWGAQITLDNADVLNNHGTYGGGIYATSNSAITITSETEVRDNTATYAGGGAQVYGRLYGHHSRPPTGGIYSNCAPDGGGVSVPGGNLDLNASSVYLNRAADTDGQGGGIHLTSGGEVRLTNTAYVYYLNEAYDGAGIYADNGTVHMEGVYTTLRDNVASHYGGGVYLTNNSTLHSDGARIGQPDGAHLANEAQYGAGIYAENSTVDFDGGSIINNIASSAGGGVYATGSTLNLTDASVGGTGYSEANQLGPSFSAYGAGMYLDNTQATLSNTVVASNTFDAGSYATFGGGAYASNGSVLTLINSRVERHLGPGSLARGGGIYVSNSTVTLDNSQVLSNTANTNGGGLRLYSANTLNVLNNSVIRNNKALNAEGGGVAASGTTTITISDATLQSNIADTDGGAIYVNGGTLDFSGWWDVQSNQAGRNGGAVAVLGTGDADFRALDTSYLSNNTAYGDGGALYVSNNDDVQLYAYSNWLGFTGNYAAGNGGAAYAANGAYFDTWGQVLVTANRAPNGNGGAFYLSGGSRLWLDDYGDSRPQIRVNWAREGGAVYASDSPGVRCDGAEFGWTTGNGNRAEAGSGGAIYLSGSDFSAENCTFHDGQATEDGGAIAAYTSTLTIDARYATSLAAAPERAGERDRLDSTNAPLATGCDPLAGECSSFYNNTADSDGDNTGNGGAIYANDSTLQVDTTYLHRNSAGYGGAIFQEGPNALAQVNNTLVYSNTSTLGGGAGIRTAGGTFTVTHVTLANNMGGAGFSSWATSSAAHNSIAWGNEIGGFWGTYAPSTCNIDQNGNVGTNVDPQFVAPGAGENYHLLGSSPAIDQCATGLTPDLDNATRPVGSAYDMGAYEYPYVIEFTPDNTGIGLPTEDVIYAHTLTNAGGIADTYTLTAQSSQGWPVAITPSPTVTLGAGGSTPVSVTVSIPAGTLSDTVDTTTVTATSGGDPSLSAQVTDQTTVGFAPGAAFEPDGVTIGAVEGNTYNYTHWLTNTGNAQDTFNLAWSSTPGWGSLLTPGPFVLNPNQSTSVIVAATVPMDGSGQSDTTVVTATSLGDAGPVVVRDVTSAFTPGVAFSPDRAQTVSPDTIVTYTHRVTNTGGSTDTVHLALSSTQGWGTLIDAGPFELVQGGSTTVRVQVTVPPGSGGMADTTVVTATTAAGAGPVAVRDTTATYVPGVAFEPDHSQAIPAGDSITYTHRLTNTGQGPDTFDLALSTSQGWASLVDGGPSALNSGEATDVRVRVDTPFGSGGQTDVATVVATSVASPTVSAGVTDTTTAIRTYGVAFEPDYGLTLDPGQSFTYTHWLTNTGNATDTFDLTPASSEGWATLLDTGPYILAASQAVTVRVRVDVPLGSGGLSDIATVVATSVASPTVSAGVTDTTTATYAPGVQLVPDYSQTRNPGDTFTHTHWLTNTGNGPDYFDLGFGTSQGWATLLDLGPFHLQAGDGVTVNVRVDVPAGSGGLVDTTMITATARSGGLSATVTDTTSVFHIPGVQLEPDYAMGIAPGTTHIYVHNLENIGNGPDTFDLAFWSSSGQATLLDPGPVTLNAGVSAQVRVSVTVPSGLISGTLVDVAVVTATSQADPILFDTATDTTRAGFVPDATFVPDYVTTDATPGNTYNYTHTLTNTGNYTDTFDLVFASSAGWGNLLDPGPFTLGIGASEDVHVAVTAGSGNQSDASIITATSQGGAGPFVVRDTTATFIPSVAFAPDYEQTVNPGQSVTYTHQLTNTSLATDTIKLSLDSSRGWGVLLDPGPFTLSPNESISVRVLVIAPPSSGSLADVSVVTAATLNGAGPSAQVTDTTRVTYAPGVALEPDQAQTVPTGSAVVYTHWLTNTGDGPDTFSLALHSSQGWSTLLDPGPFALSAGDSTQVRVQVDVPTDTLPFEVDVTTITATASLGGMSATASDTTTVACVPLAGASFTFNPPAPQIEQSVTFTGTVAAGSQPFTYIWSFGDGNTGSGKSVAHTYTASGTFTVLMTVTNFCDQITATRDIAISPPAPDINVIPLTLSAILNPNDTTTQTLNLSNLGTGNLDWSLVENPTATWLNEAPTSGLLAPSGSTPVEVGFDATGLSDAAYATTLRISSNDPDEPHVNVDVSLTVTSTCIPVSGASFGYDPSAPLKDEMVTFTGSVVQGTEPITYTWSFDDGTATQTGNPIQHTFTTSGTFTVLMTATNTCPGQATATHDVVVITAPDVTVSPPSLSVALAPDDTTNRTLTIGNVGAGDLDWNLTESPIRTWLSELPISGTIAPAGSTPVNVTFDATGQITGTYTTTLQVASNDPDEPLVSVPVTLTVSAEIVPDHAIYLPAVMRDYVP